MPRWTVTTRDGIEDVFADHAEIVGGTLIFRDGDDLGISVAYSPTTWTTVTRDEDD